MKHLKQEWFQRSLEASNKGPGYIYAFRSLAIRERAMKFKEEGAASAEIYSRYFKPNPFVYQYDLLVYCWVHFREILNEEIILLRKKAKKEQNEFYNEKANEIATTDSLYGIRRADFMYGACELRWPSRLMKGAYRGPMVRDPWMEARVEAFSDEKYKFLVVFGGGGQGKTLTFIGLNLILWDHFIYTQKGARCLISTVNKDKLNSASWSYLQQLINSTERNISLYAGQGVISGDHTVRRPNNKDLAGIFKGILLQDRLDDSSIVDKLTGSHGHPYFGYIMDEMQSTPEAPITASANYTIHADDFRICGAGNYNTDEDTLGENAKPPEGWDSVDSDTGQWVSYMKNNQPAIVMHFSNDRSPGMTEEGEKMFPYLPNRKKLERLYPKIAARTIENKRFRRFWLGWRIVNEDADTVLVRSVVESTGCNKNLDLSSVLDTFFSFDSAQAEGDRNLLAEFKEGYDRETNERVFGNSDLMEQVKTTDALKYYTESAEWIFDQAKKRRVKSGHMILDWTGRPAQAEILSKMNFETILMTYNQGVPNGVRKDVRTNRVLKKMVIDPDPQHLLYAHQVAGNMISLGAWLLQQYVQSGRVRGLNEEMMNLMLDHQPIDQELYSRKFEYKNSSQFGSLAFLVPKKEFKNQYGFSPDYLDVWCQAAYYMFSQRNLPINPIVSGGEEAEVRENDIDKQMEDHNDIWTDDLLPV